MVWRYEKPTTNSRTTSTAPMGSEALSAAVPASSSTRMISSVAYATLDSASDESTASALRLVRRSWPAAAVASGSPMIRRLSREYRPVRPCVRVAPPRIS
jgi:hypothetical protein